MNLVFFFFATVAPPLSAHAQFTCRLSEAGQREFRRLSVTECEDAFCVMGTTSGGRSFRDPQRATHCDSASYSCEMEGRWVDSSFVTINPGEPNESLRFTLLSKKTGEVMAGCR